MENLINVGIFFGVCALAMVAYKAFAIKPYTRAYNFKNGIEASKMYNNVASNATQKDIETYEMLNK